MSKITCRGQILTKRSCSSNISSSNIIADQNHVHNTRPSNTKRTSTKPLCESRQVINYARLNDSLDPEHSPSPKRKCQQKIRPSATGPSVTCAAAYANSRNKKLAGAATGNEGEIADLEEIMESIDSNVIGTIVKVDKGDLQKAPGHPPKNYIKQCDCYSYKCGSNWC